MEDWLLYEQLAAKIFNELHGEAEVKHNDRILGRQSGQYRQIDVSIRSKIEGYNVLIIIQAKNYKRKIDINTIGELSAVIKDVGATKGIIVCNAGFSKSALIYARNLGIELCSLHDTENRKWSLDIKIPILWTDLHPILNIKLEGLFLEEGDSFFKHPKDWVLSNDKGKTRLLPINTFVSNWNKGLLNRNAGMHIITPLQSNIQVMLFDKYNNRIWRDFRSVYMEYEVERKSWLGYFSPADCRGVLNRLNGAFVASYLKFGDIPLKKDENWIPIDDAEKLAISIIGTFVTSESYEVKINGSEIWNVNMILESKE